MFFCFIIPFFNLFVPISFCSLFDVDPSHVFFPKSLFFKIKTITSSNAAFEAFLHLLLLPFREWLFSP